MADLGQFYKSIDEGDYHQAEYLLNNLELNEKEYLLYKTILLFREQKFDEALENCESKKELCTDYMLGTVYFVNGQYEKAIPFLIENIKSANFYTKLVSEIYLIDSYIFTDNKKEAFKVCKDILSDYSGVDYADNIFDGKRQFLLIAAYDSNIQENIKEQLLLDYFNASKKERYKIFNDILKYSQYLGFTPDKIFPFMKETEVFEEDGYFWWVLLEKDNLSDYDYYKEIWFWENLILAQIMLDSSSKIKSINHYTTSAALQFMLDGSKIRKTSLSNANDKVEGNVLPILLYKNGLPRTTNCENNNIYAALQTSYSRNINSLTMFRLYGKKDNNEGTGISLVFNINFFQTNPCFVRFDVKEDDNCDINGLDKRNPIFWILYYNEERNILYYYPNEDPLKPYIIDLNLKSKSLKWNCFFSKKDKQNMKQRNLVYSFCRLIKVINSETDKDRLEIAIEILYKLRYFIKVDDFSEEKELRMLELVNPKDADIEKSNNVLYKDYLGILKYDSLEKIILGPKIEKPQVMKELATKKILEKDSNVLVEISTAPLA